MAQFGMEFTVRPNKGNPNDTLIIKVDPYATVDKDQDCCGKDSQKMFFQWKVKDTNSSYNLHRNMTLLFKRENTTL